MIRFTCPGCGANPSADAPHGDESSICPDCGHQMIAEETHMPPAERRNASGSGHRFWKELSVALVIAAAAAIPVTAFILKSHTHVAPASAPASEDGKESGGDSIPEIVNDGKPMADGRSVEGSEAEEDADIIPELYVDSMGNTLDEGAFHFYTRGYGAADPQVEAAAAKWTMGHVYSDEQRSACLLTLEGLQDRAEGLPMRYKPAKRTRAVK